MSVTSKYLLTLDDTECTEPGRCGEKAATLARLARTGFAVPDTVVLTTDAFAAAGPAGDLPEAVERAVIEAAARFDTVPLAVRSSSAAEDRADRSFAGQYESVVGVRGAENLVRAVRTVWRSATSDRVTSYAGQRSAPMAVLIQRLIDPDVAGVAFTADPVTGDRSTTVVEAVQGLGDRAASGEQTPERWTISDDGAARRTGDVDGVLADEQARAVAGVARAAAADAGCPQDVEWAIEDGKVWLLQARPITTLAERPIDPVPVPVDVPEGYWERESSHAPRPHTPFNRVIFQPRNRGSKISFHEIGALPETLEFTEVGGWEYTRLVPPGGKDRKPPPRWLFALLVRVAPPLRARARRAREALRRLRDGEMVDRWYRQWRPELAGEIAQLRDADLTVLSDAELDEHLASTLDLFDRSCEIHFRLHPVWAIPFYELATACRNLLGWDEDQACALLSGLSGTTTEPARKLAELAVKAAGHPELTALIAQASRDALPRIAELDPGFAAAFEDYRHTCGCRALRYEVAEPTLGEQPDLLLGLVADHLTRDFDPAALSGATEELRSRTRAQAEQAMSGLPLRQRTEFATLLDRARRAHPVREDNEWYTVSAPLALIRFAALEVGARLAVRQQLERADDVFFLHAVEARAALDDGTDQRDLVLRRTGERAWTESHPGPASYGTPPPSPPSLRGLPEGLRVINEAMLWTVERVFAAKHSTAQQDFRDGRISGIAASPGRYSGTVRVIHGADEFDKLRAGDVVVCPVTSPVWSVLFPSMGALVTDSGGMLSHPAIIAREYHLPAVVATGNATHLLNDGQLVTVDGTSGTVMLS